MDIINNKYELIEQIGEGGMGAVWRAKQLDIDREVAIKFISSALMKDAQFSERFRREAQTAGRLDHPNILQIYDYGDNYMVMPFLAGGSLRDRIEAGERIPLTQIAAILLPIADALDYAHSQGVIHRDIKPDNIMFDGRGTVKIVDFGVAYLQNASVALTQTGSQIGTRLYMSPEQWRGLNLTGASDQYSLAVMVYMLVAGYPPFESDTAEAIMYAHLEKLPPNIPDAPKKVNAVLQKALSKEPEKRYANVSEFAKAFTAAVMDEKTGPMSLTPPTAKKSRTTWIVAGGVILVVLVGIVLLLLSSGGGDDSISETDSETEAALIISDTPTATETESPSGTPTDEAEALAPLETETAIFLARVETSTALALTDAAIDAANTHAFETANAVPTETPTETQTPTLSVEEIALATVNAQATGQAVVDAERTQVAQMTVDAIQVETRVAELQATQVTWTPTPTLTLTPTATFTLTPLEAAFVQVTTNADWSPLEEDFNGVTMVLVPAGCFTMGSVDGAENEQPVQTVCFDEPFWIDKTEVTNAQYGSVGCGDVSSEPNQPRNCVHWSDAQAFCEAWGGRLPTEAEWEYAARGPDGLIYPWGNEYNAALVIGVDDPTYGGQRTAPAGSRPGGASWIGALDMSGNVWEWTSSPYLAYPYSQEQVDEATDTSDRVLRGGSWYNSDSFTLRASERGWYSPSVEFYDFGFRCVRDYATDTTARPTVIPTTTEVSTEAPTEVAFAVSSNADWTPIEREFDGVTMVLVPAGCFMMGSTDEQIDYAVNELYVDRNLIANEQPVEKICFDEPFWIDKYEVTNEQYGSVGCRDYSSESNQPRNCVGWLIARDFCEARGGSLPTEAQWEYAARGPDGLIYPWGDDAIFDNAVYITSSTSDVGSRPGGASWVGAMDMSGNLWEWTSSLYRDYPYGADHESGTDTNSGRVFRGGSFRTNQDDLRSANRNRNNPTYNFNDVGFRCVRDYQ